MPGGAPGRESGSTMAPRRPCKLDRWPILIAALLFAAAVGFRACHPGVAHGIKQSGKIVVAPPGPSAPTASASASPSATGGSEVVAPVLPAYGRGGGVTGPGFQLFASTIERDRRAPGRAPALPWPLAGREVLRAAIRALRT